MLLCDKLKSDDVFHLAHVNNYSPIVQILYHYDVLWGVGRWDGWDGGMAGCEGTGWTS